MHNKYFQGWHTLKERLHNKLDTQIISIKEREIWWCSIDINIGDEENGHNVKSPLKGAFYILPFPCTINGARTGFVANANL
jgi:hypothetical protein